MIQEHGGHGGYTEDTKVFWPEFSRAIIGCGIRVHSKLGPGLLESLYEECLCHELNRDGIPFRRQVETPVRYDDVTLNVGLRLDLLVDGRAIIEVKAVEQILPLHEAQLLTYLRCTRLRLGFLMNFNVRHFREGLCRKVL